MKVSNVDVLRLLTAMRECSRHVERATRAHPLDEADVGILTLAAETDGQLRPSQAADYLEISQPSVTRHVRALRERGYLAIDPDADDRRGYRISVTAAGRRMLGDFRQELATRFAPALDGWSAADVRALADGLSRLNTAMDAALESRTRRGRSSTWWRPAAG